MGRMSKEHLNDCSPSFTQLPASTRLLRGLRNSHLVLHLSVSVLWSMFVFAMEFMLRVGKKQHSPPSPSALLCNFCQMNSVES